MFPSVTKTLKLPINITFYKLLFKNKLKIKSLITPETKKEIFIYFKSLIEASFQRAIFKRTNFDFVMWENPNDFIPEP